MKSIGHKQLIEMLARFRNRDEYLSLKSASQAEICEWRRASGPMMPHSPHEKIVYGCPPSAWVTKKSRNDFLHGLDRNGRILAIRFAELRVPDDEVIEQFLIHEDAGFWRIFFEDEPKKPPVIVEWWEIVDSQWNRTLSITRNSVREELLRWESGLLQEQVVRNWEGVSTRDAEAALKARFSKHGNTNTVYSYSYASDGTLEKVTEQTFLGADKTPVTSGVKYQRLPKGVSLKSLLDDVEELLIFEIPKTIREAKIKETVYCLLLQFSGVDTDPCGFSPPMILALDATRKNLLAQHANGANYDAWAINELRNIPGTIELSCSDCELDEKLKLIFQLTIQSASNTSYTPVRKMFQRVCLRLNALNWKGILRTTDDFVAFPCDNHGELDPSQDVKASVPKDKIQLLLDRKLIWPMKLK